MPSRTLLEQAQHIRGLLTEELQTLILLEEELRNGPPQDIPKRVRPDQVSIAIGYLQKAVVQLDRAIGDSVPNPDD